MGVVHFLPGEMSMGFRWPLWLMCGAPYGLQLLTIISALAFMSAFIPLPLRWSIAFAIRLTKLEPSVCLNVCSQEAFGCQLEWQMQ